MTKGCGVQIYLGRGSFSIQLWRRFWHQVHHRTRTFQRHQSIHLMYKGTWRASPTYWRMWVQWELLKALCNTTHWTTWESRIVLLATGKYPDLQTKVGLFFTTPDSAPCLSSGVYCVLSTGRLQRSPSHSWETHMTTLFRWQPTPGLWTMTPTTNTR